MIHHFRLAQSPLPPCYLLHLSLWRCTLIPKDCYQTFSPNGLLVVHQIGVFFTMFINFTRAKKSMWYVSDNCNTVPRKEQQPGNNMTVPSINPVGLPLSSSGHKVKKLGTKWSKLLGTRTKLTENIRPPTHCLDSRRLWVHGLKNRPSHKHPLYRWAAPFKLAPSMETAAGVWWKDARLPLFVPLRHSSN